MEHKAYIIENICPKTAKTLRELRAFEIFNNVYYNGCGLTIRKGKKISYVIVDKQTDGAIIYLANGVYTLGRFFWLTNKMLDKLISIEVTKIDESYSPSQWRDFFNYRKVVENFKNPIKKLESDINQYKTTIESYNSQLIEMEKKYAKYSKL